MVEAGLIVREHSPKRPSQHPRRRGTGRPRGARAGHCRAELRSPPDDALNDDDRAALAEALIQIVGSDRSEGQEEPDSHQQCDCPLTLSGWTMKARRTAHQPRSILRSWVVRVFVTGAFGSISSIVTSECTGVTTIVDAKGRQQKVRNRFSAA
jgi:hypothetical protein